MNLAGPDIRSRTRLVAVATTALLLLGSCGRQAPRPDDPVRLVLFLVVDQARYDYLVRFRPLLSGGLAWLLDEGVSFTDAHHDHARTLTGPGHATLASGRHPSGHGIVGNYWLDDEGAPVYCVHDEDYGVSPRALRTDTLPDWLDRRDPHARVFAAGGKDRSAILTGGLQADAAYWFDRTTGDFVTSEYYPHGAPGWLEEFNDADHLEALFGTAWRPLWEQEPGLDDLVLQDYGVEIVDMGAYTRGFPRALGGLDVRPDWSFYQAIYGSPFLDEHLARLARELIEHEGLGQDGVADYLSLAFSSLDAVGHDHGPDSPEVLDTILRLDRALGALLELVDRRIGLHRVLVSLSSDHGVPRLPELGHDSDAPAPGERVSSRVTLEDVLCYQSVWTGLRELFGDEVWAWGLYEDVYLDHDAIQRHGLEAGAVRERARALLESCPSVTEVWTPEELVDPAPDPDPHRLLFSHTYHPERSPDLYVQFRSTTLNVLGTGTTHGSPYSHDTWVPMIIAAPDRPAGSVRQRVHTVDLAPTLAALLGLEPPDDVDGVDRSALLGPRSAARYRKVVQP